MNNSTQLKALIKNLAKEKGISAQIILQYYMMERLLDRISLSKYHHNFIVKGGFLISSMVGLNTRATMDLDATVKNLPFKHEPLSQIFTELCAVEAHDNVTFNLKRVINIRDNDRQGGARIMLDANYPPIVVPLKVDLTSGDRITPNEVFYEFRFLFEPRSIKMLAYNLETIIAEKLETIISRGNQNTRPRDFYDIYILNQLYGHQINRNVLRNALLNTAEKRESTHILIRYSDIIHSIIHSPMMHKHWASYQKDFYYAKNIDFQMLCTSIDKILSTLNLKIH